MERWWSYFNQIYVISVEGSKNQDIVRKNLAAVGIDNPKIMSFMPAKKQLNDGSNAPDLTLKDVIFNEGCDDTCQNISSNHLSVIKRAFEDGCDNVLIFEDVHTVL